MSGVRVRTAASGSTIDRSMSSPKSGYQTWQKPRRSFVRRFRPDQ